MELQLLIKLYLFHLVRLVPFSSSITSLHWFLFLCRQILIDSTHMGECSFNIQSIREHYKMLLEKREREREKKWKTIISHVNGQKSMEPTHTHTHFFWLCLGHDRDLFTLTRCCLHNRSWCEVSCCGRYCCWSCVVMVVAVAVVNFTSTFIVLSHLSSWFLW